MAPHLATEAFFNAGYEWGACFTRTPESFVSIASFGNSGFSRTLPVDQLESILVNGENAVSLTVGRCHLFLLPAASAIPNELGVELDRIGRLADSVPGAGSTLAHALDENCAVSLLNHGRTLELSTISFFAIDFSDTIDSFTSACPHVLNDSLIQDLGRMCKAILGSSGACYTLDETRVLCAHYSRNEGDPELFAIQTQKALRTAMQQKGSGPRASPPYTVVSIVDSNASTAISSFINGCTR